MMQVAFYSRPEDFLQRCGGFLRAHEAEHNLILSLCRAAEKRRSQGEKAELHCGVLFDNDVPVLAAVQTPPHNLVLSKAEGADCIPLVEALAQHGERFPGIVGPSDVAGAFANHWTQLTGQKAVEYMDQIIYTLKAVEPPPAPPPGAFRYARAAEAPLLAGWMAAFSRGVLPKAEWLDEPAALKKAQELIAQQRLAVWAVKDQPVAQAAVSGTDEVARISMVYTPPEARGHGYASAVVAALSQAQLDAGRRMCCLYADARNPVSNSIYRKIGYEFVGRSSHYVLEKNAA